jgi:hypothetical protein
MVAPSKTYLFTLWQDCDAPRASSTGVLLVLCPYRLLAISLFKYDAISSPRCLASSSARFLLKTYSNMMHYPLLAALLRPLLCSFLIKSLPKYDAISSPRCLASCCARFLLNPYSNMIRYPFLAALPPPVFVSY